MTITNNNNDNNKLITITKILITIINFLTGLAENLI